MWGLDRDLSIDRRIDGVFDTQDVAKDGLCSLGRGHVDEVQRYVASASWGRGTSALWLVADETACSLLHVKRVIARSVNKPRIGRPRAAGRAVTEPGTWRAIPAVGQHGGRRAILKRLARCETEKKDDRKSDSSTPLHAMQRAPLIAPCADSRHRDIHRDHFVEAVFARPKEAARLSPPCRRRLPHGISAIAADIHHPTPIKGTNHYCRTSSHFFGQWHTMSLIHTKIPC
jgi:hypothetical protein